MKPFCFIIMPFGKKKYKPAGNDDEWVSIDFDEVYTELIQPAIRDAGMEPIKADEEKARGSIHKPMFERILLSDYVVADLTGANANVFYELGIRHAVKPYTTVSIFAQNSELPFDLKPFRCYPYEYVPGQGLQNISVIRKLVTRDLFESKMLKATDSPVYQLIDGIHFQNSVAHGKTDIFRKKVMYDENLKEELKSARLAEGDKTAKVKALQAVIETHLSPLEDQEAGVLIDAMLSFRDILAYEEMERFITRLPVHVKQTVMVQEQYAFALNRNKKREKAIEVLVKVIAENGPSSETYGILGRVYKDKYYEAVEAQNDLQAAGFLNMAIETYRKGFEADWRDAYPGINLLTLLDIKGDKENVYALAPVVSYSVERKIQSKTPVYWDHAILVTIAVLTNDRDKAIKGLQAAVTCWNRAWMLQTTIDNLQLVLRTRQQRKEDTTLAETVLEALRSNL